MVNNLRRHHQDVYQADQQILGDIPDAGRAYQITSQLLRETGWSWDLNFHYRNNHVIFALVMIHMLRVLVSGAYRRARRGCG
jgi:quinol-cytochrome oxidoreductase complex cytochrome b subunit